MNRQLFEYGVSLAIRKLRDLKGQADLRADAGILTRIAQLKARTAGSRTPGPAAVLEPSKSDTAAVADADPQAAVNSRQQHDATVFNRLRERVLSCTKCPHLVAFRHSVVFGVGNPEAELMFVGEAPGAEEDMQGEPFVGRAGELLTKIIQAMGFQRSEVYIANILKCRPDLPAGSPGNRPPTSEEMQTCLPYLREQIECIQPKVMVALGGVAMRGLFGRLEPMRSLRGKWHLFGSIPVMATFHPSYLLRNQAWSEKRTVWEDMLLVLERMRRPINDRQRNFFLNKQPSGQSE